MIKYCKKIMFSDTGEVYDIKDAEARSSITDLQNSHNSLVQQVNPLKEQVQRNENRIAQIEGGMTGSHWPWGIDTITVGAPAPAYSNLVEVTTADLDRPLEGTKVFFKFIWAGADALPSFEAYFGNLRFDRSSDNAFLIPHCPPNVDMYQYCMECWYVDGKFTLYVNNMEYTASSIRAGVIGTKGANTCKVTYMRTLD